MRRRLAQLGLAHERVELDILKGETRTPAFLSLNPNGRIPLLELDDGRTLAESNTIQWYLAEQSPLLPSNPYERAQVLQWMCFEQYSHKPYIAVLRFWTLDEHTNELPARRASGQAALGVMEEHLATRNFFVSERYSGADIALYAYSHVAPEGGFELQTYPAIRSWLGRVASQAGHVPMNTVRPASP